VLTLAPFEVAMDEACFATLLDYVEVMFSFSFSFSFFFFAFEFLSFNFFRG
jgi:hypothetical protein